MFIEEFNDYLSIPFMTKSRDYRKNTRTENIDTLFHYHKEMELLAVLEGSARLFVNEEVYEIEKGDLVVIAPYTPHRYTIFADRDFKHCCMCFDLDILYDKELNRDFMAGNRIYPQLREPAYGYGRGGFFLDTDGTDSYSQTGRRNGRILFDDSTKGGVFLDHRQKDDEPAGAAFFWEEAKIKYGYWKETLE